MIYKTNGTCCIEIVIDMKDDIIQSVTFTNGCKGNLHAIGRLVIGMKATDVIEKLSGITCGKRETSCPDQLAQALNKL